MGTCELCERESVETTVYHFRYLHSRKSYVEILKYANGAVYPFYNVAVSALFSGYSTRGLA
jgi:hypothetical protein